MVESFILPQFNRQSKHTLLKPPLISLLIETLYLLTKKETSRNAQLVGLSYNHNEQRRFNPINATPVSVCGYAFGAYMITSRCPTIMDVVHKSFSVRSYLCSHYTPLKFYDIYPFNIHTHTLHISIPIAASRYLLFRWTDYLSSFPTRFTISNQGSLFEILAEGMNAVYNYVTIYMYVVSGSVSSVMPIPIQGE